MHFLKSQKNMNKAKYHKMFLNLLMVNVDETIPIPLKSQSVVT